VRYTIAIEAADGLTENAALLSNARRHELIAGVVGWVPLAKPIEVERALELYAKDAALSASGIWSMSSPIPTGSCARMSGRVWRFWHPEAWASTTSASYPVVWNMCLKSPEKLPTCGS
jgi:hypothetical protein